VKLISAALIVLLPLLQQISGTVVGVHDGDSITLRSDDGTIKVRLYGIDAPELGQAFSQVAKQKLSDLCFGKTVTLVSFGEDRYGRTLADVILEDSTNVNHELLRAGLAWYFRKYVKSAELEAIETEAKDQKRGLWDDANPIPPWEYRKIPATPK
jgi:micrococcal nuclease